MVELAKPAQEDEMCLAPIGDVLIIIAARNGAANGQKQDFAQKGT